jgi:hypothetical protein
MSRNRNRIVRPPPAPCQRRRGRGIRPRLLRCACPRSSTYEAYACGAGPARASHPRPTAAAPAAGRTQRTPTSPQGGSFGRLCFVALARSPQRTGRRPLSPQGEEAGVRGCWAWLDEQLLRSETSMGAWLAATRPRGRQSGSKSLTETGQAITEVAILAFLTGLEGAVIMLADEGSPSTLKGREDASSRTQ